ncbi:MAG: hypothetical protein HZA46_15345, partial [Planctomycetales bacterium]|nr:hypothetical protein [Planctomycetales bacterium]
PCRCSKPSLACEDKSHRFYAKPSPTAHSFTWNYNSLNKHSFFDGLLGERCIQSLARGAVRERMLFNRLAEGGIELPDFNTQVKTSQALAQMKPMRAAIQKQIEELKLLPQKLLAQVFESY